VELFLLVWAVAILAVSRSRISQFGFLLVAAGIAIVLGWKLLDRIERRAGLTRAGGSALRRVGLAALNVLILLAMVAGLLFGAAAAAGRTDPRLWALPSIADRLEDSRRFYPSEAAFAVGDRLAFAERMAYWTSAFRTFSLYPVLGVGPGNAGFLFERTLVDYAQRLTEIQKLLREASYGFPNPKNLWTRLLAETGIVGFVLFAWWLVSTALGGLVLWGRGEKLGRMLGLACALAFLAQLVEGFSLDTFALPQLWLLFGLTTAALWASGILQGAPRLAPDPGQVSPGSQRAPTRWTAEAET
jgi:O-antigen ligase